MKRIVAAVCAVVVVAAVAVGARLTVLSPDAPCQKPRTILSSEQTASIAVLETYISDNIAPTFKSPKFLQWASDDYNPAILPNKISVRIMIVAGVEAPRYYHVTLARDCQGGDWKVVEFKRLPS